MNQTPPEWRRLVASARPRIADRDGSAPSGFATRVAALAWADERPATSLVERFSLRAIGVATLLAAAAVAANYSSVRHLFDEPTTAVSDDPMTEMVDLATS